MSIYNQTQAAPVVLNFSSRNRIAGSNSKFISSPLNLGINNYDSVALVQASIPRSFYNVPSAYSTMTLRELGVNYTVTLTPASYNKLTYATALQAALNLYSGNGWTYTVSYSSPLSGDTFKYEFTVSGNSGQPSLIFTDALHRQTGFDENSTNTFVMNSLFSENCINLSYITRAFIKSNVCAGAQDGILEEILNYGSFAMLSLCYFQQPTIDLNTRTFNNSGSNSWEFSLVDSFDQEIDLNGIPWSFSLVFFKRNDTHEFHKTDLLITNEERIFKISQEQDKVREQINSSQAVIQVDPTTLEPYFKLQVTGTAEKLEKIKNYS